MTHSSTLETDIVVIGAGPGGYPAAFACADHGMQVTLVNAEEKPGGVCLHRGCIPSKALLHVAKLIQETRESEQWGVTFGHPKIDVDKLRSFKNGVIEKLVGGVAQLYQSTRGVAYVSAAHQATFADSNTLNLQYPDGKAGQITFKHAIPATGSSPAVPALFKKDDPRVMDSTGAAAGRHSQAAAGDRRRSTSAWKWDRFMRRSARRIVVVEMLPGLLAGADRELVRPLQKRLDGLFEAIHLSTKVEDLDVKKAGITARLVAEDGKATEEKFDRVLVAVGRRPNSQDLWGSRTPGPDRCQRVRINLVDAQRPA